MDDHSNLQNHVSQKSTDDSLEITNHLANERTYLAWLRTGVSMMGLGVVIAKLEYILGANYAPSSGIMHAAHIGLLFAATGVLTVVLAVVFFLQTQKEIRNGDYKSRNYFVLTLAILIGVLGLSILWYLTQPTGLSQAPS